MLPSRLRHPSSHAPIPNPPSLPFDPFLSPFRSPSYLPLDPFPFSLSIPNPPSPFRSPSFLPFDPLPISLWIPFLSPFRSPSSLPFDPLPFSLSILLYSCFLFLLLSLSIPVSVSLSLLRCDQLVFRWIVICPGQDTVMAGAWEARRGDGTSLGVCRPVHRSCTRLDERDSPRHGAPVEGRAVVR